MHSYDEGWKPSNIYRRKEKKSLFSKIYRMREDFFFNIMEDDEDGKIIPNNNITIIAKMCNVETLDYSNTI